MKIVLAYSGGLDTSVLMSWIKEKYNAEMIGFCADIGGRGIERPRKRRPSRPARPRFTLITCREEFAGDFIYPMIRAGRFTGQYFSARASRVRSSPSAWWKSRRRKSRRHRARCDRQRQRPGPLRTHRRRAAPELQVIAPWRDERYRSEFPGRQQMIDYCAKHKIPVQASARSPYSMDRNLLHISYEAGILEDPWYDSYDLKNRGYFCTLSCLPEDAPNKPEFVELDFVKGDCVAVNGKKLNPLGVMKALNKLRWQTRRRPRGHGREPFRRHEIARRV